MTEHDKVEQIKKPSTGASITRKINIGEKYESLELEVWRSSGTLDDSSQEAVREELEVIVEDLSEIVESRAEAWKAQDLSAEDLEDVLEDANRDLSAGNVEAAGEKLRNILEELRRG